MLSMTSEVMDNGEVGQSEVKTVSQEVSTARVVSSAGKKVSMRSS